MGLGVLLLAYLLYLVRSTVVLVGIAVMLMAALHPLVQLATRRGLSHGAAVAVVMLSLVPLAMVVALSPLIISEVQGFAHNVPTLQQHIDDLASRRPRLPGEQRHHQSGPRTSP